MSRLFAALAFVPLVALVVETAYGMFAITELSRVFAWVLLVECPTLILAIFGVQSWIDRPSR